MRKTKVITIEDEGRDKGKSYLITEMPLFQGEEWALRVIMEVARAMQTLPAGFDGTREWFQLYGMEWLASSGIKVFGNLEWITTRQLMQELIDCIEYLPNKNDMRVKHKEIYSVTEEIPTMLRLKWEVINLHFDFFIPGGP